MADKSAITVFPLGCSLTALYPPNEPNICVAFSSESLQQESGNPPFFGETIGRIANRISNGQLDLNGQTYHLPLKNGDNGQNTLHGGKQGFGKKTWDGPNNEDRADSSGAIRQNARKYTLSSPHGDEGFPGNVEARAWWSTWEEQGKTIVEVEYEAEMLPEQPAGVEETAVAMTNHSYFNVSPSRTSKDASISGSVLHLNTDRYLALRASDNIPTGEIAALPSSKPGEGLLLGDNAPVLDHCFVLNPHPETVPVDTRSQPLQTCCTLMHPENNVCLQVLSTEPAFQVYSGDGIENATNGAFGRRSGMAIEPSRYIDAINRPEWRGMVVLKKGEKYGSRIRYVAWTHEQATVKS